MSIWSTLYALREDDGLESTLIRPVFDGMPDLATDSDPCAGWILFTGTWTDTGTWIDTCTWSD